MSSSWDEFIHAPGSSEIVQNFIHMSQTSPHYPLVALQYIEFDQIDMAFVHDCLPDISVVTFCDLFDSTVKHLATAKYTHAVAVQKAKLLFMLCSVTNVENLVSFLLKNGLQQCVHYHYFNQVGVYLFNTSQGNTSQRNTAH